MNTNNLPKQKHKTLELYSYPQKKWVNLFIRFLLLLFGKRVKGSISKKLIAVVLTVSSIFAFIATLLQIGVEYSDSLSNIEKHFSIIENSYMAPIASSIWNYNEDMLNVQMMGIMNIPGVVFIEIHKKKEVIATIGKKQNNTISKKFKIEYSNEDTIEPLGEAIVNISLKEIQSQIVKKVFFIFIILLLKTLVVSLLVYVIFRHMLIDHVIAIEKYIHLTSKNLNIDPLSLDRIKVDKNDVDEIDKLASTINLVKEKLVETNFQLVQSSKLASLGEMSAGIAHELNNPLHFIKGFNNRIKASYKKSESLPYEKISTYVEKINENCARMIHIIKHFREFTRGVQQELTPIHINDVIEKSFILLNEQMRLKKISIQKNLSPDNPIVLGDPNRLEQVFINLLGNARDAFDNINSEKKVINITTKTSHSSVIIEFQDNGCGISQEKLDKIFNPFFTTKEVGKGTGLGLSISHGIINEHKGTITCESKVNSGTLFKIIIKKYIEDTSHHAKKVS